MKLLKYSSRLKTEMMSHFENHAEFFIMYLDHLQHTDLVDGRVEYEKFHA